MSEDSTHGADGYDPDEPVGSFAPWRALLVVLAVAVVLGVIAVVVVGFSSDDKKPTAATPTTSQTLAIVPTTSTAVVVTTSSTNAVTTAATTAVTPTGVVSSSTTTETSSIAAPTPTEALLVPVESTTISVSRGPTSSTMPVPFVGPLSSDPAAVAMVDALNAKAQGRLEDFYALLHPALRAKVPIKTFKKCYAPTSDDRNSVIDVYGLGDADFAHALIPERKAKVVGLRFRLKGQTVERQFFVINSAQDNGWRWVLSAEQVAELTDGRCA